MSEFDIQNWLTNITETIRNKDLKKHMDLVSENVVIYGMPNGETLNYADWYGRRKSEFGRGLLKNVSYNNLKIKTLGLRSNSLTLAKQVKVGKDVMRSASLERHSLRKQQSYLTYLLWKATANG